MGDQRAEAAVAGGKISGRLEHFGTMAINYESDIFFNPLICQQIGFLARKLSLTKVRNG
jgi:hypothetical protein